MNEFNPGTVWEFQTANFVVTLELEMVNGYEYDGDDADGETQRMLNEGELVAFDSRVAVYKRDGTFIAADYLGSSVYGCDDVSSFYTAHRTSSDEYRNTLANKARNVAIGHYFPNMVREACRSARETLKPFVRLRSERSAA